MIWIFAYLIVGYMFTSYKHHKECDGDFDEVAYEIMLRPMYMVSEWRKKRYGYALP